MSWKGWVAGSLGTAAIIGALAFANVAAADAGVAGSPGTQQRTSPSPSQTTEPSVMDPPTVADVDPSALPYCATQATAYDKSGPVPVGDPNEAPPTSDCFASKQEVLDFIAAQSE